MSTGRVADIWPVTPAQEGLLFHALLNPDGPDVYLVQSRFRVDGPVETEALRQAVAALTTRHPNLRACFRHKGLDRAVALVPHGVTVPWTEVDLSAYAEAEAEAELGRLLAADRVRRFDVTRPPLLRCTLVRLPGATELILTLHHILVDGWSMPILARELVELYAGRGADLPPAPRYREYLSWLRRQDTDAANEAWRAALAGLARPTLVAPDPAPRHTVVPETVEFELTAELTAAVRRRARDAGVTVNTVAQAAWALVLARMTGGDDVVFGAVVSGRPPTIPGVQDMVGLMINTVPVRVRLPGGRTGDLLRRLQDDQLELVPYHHARLAEVQRLAGTGELFDTVLAFENFPRGDDVPVPGELRLVDVRDATHYPLTVTMLAAERLWLRIIHRPEFFPRAAAELILERLVCALGVLAADADADVRRVDILPAPERQRLLAAGTGAARPPADVGVPERFAVQVARTPDAVAVESGDGRLTYRELDERADQLAGRLVAAKVGPGVPVAVLLGRSAQLVVAQLAVLRAGGHYVPLDPAQPDGRLVQLIRCAGAWTVVADEAPGWLPAGVTTVAVAAPDGPAPDGPVPVATGPDGSPASRDGRPAIRPATQAAGAVRPATRAAAGSNPDAAAYLMFTSGSTGAPKGVLATHRNVVELAADRRFGSGAHRRVLLHSPHTFDAATYELWVPLLNGGTVVVAPPGPLEPNRLEKILVDGRITALWLTAELFRAVADLAPEALAGLREVWAGGDVLAPEAVRRVQESCPATVVVNGYGPTETTTFATCHPVRGPVDGRTVPIGRPLDNTCAYVLDARLRPAPVGVVGELYLTGTGLARGYLDQPAETAVRFVAAPYAGRPGDRMYRTGDLVRWTVTGDLEFVGRADSQVKIRGHRVEPAEVEAVLESSPAVRRAVVVAGSARSTADGSPSGVSLADGSSAAGGADGAGTRIPALRLAAYLVLAPDGDVDAVRRYAAQRLPQQMLPATYQPIEALPLTAHGKVDRAALPDPPARAGRWLTAAPRSPLEASLCEHFAAVLGVPAVGRDDNFFEAGGHSLAAMRLGTAIEKALDTRVPISALYDTPTPAALAARLRSGLPDHGLAPLLTLRADGDGVPLFLLPPGMGLGWSYTALLRHLAPGRPLYALQSAVLSGAAELPASMGELAEDCLSRMRAVQPRGPYLLLGHSFGGLLGYEIAVRARRAGEPVGLLAALDSVLVAADGEPPPLPGAVLEREVLRMLLYNWGPGDLPLDALSREAVFASVRGKDGPLSGASEELLAALLDVCARHICLARTYRPSRYDGRMLFFSATGDPGRPDSTAKAAPWRRSAAQVDLHELDCRHSDMLRPGPAAAITAILEPIMRSADHAAR